MKNSAWNLSFLTFPGDFACKMALKTCDCGEDCGFFLNFQTRSFVG